MVFFRRTSVNLIKTREIHPNLLARAQQAVTVHYAGGMLLDMISVSESHTYPEFRFGLIRIVWARQCKFLAGSLKMLLFLSIVKL